jgi:hypothetical protein
MLMRPSCPSALPGLALVLLSLMAPIRAEASTGTISIDQVGAGLTKTRTGTVLQNCSNSHSGSVKMSNVATVSGITQATGSPHLIASALDTSLATAEAGNNFVFASAWEHKAHDPEILGSSDCNRMVLNADHDVTTTGEVPPEASATTHTSQAIPVVLPVTVVGKTRTWVWVNIKNKGPGTMTVQLTPPTGFHASEFVLSPLTAVTLTAGEQVPIEVTFSPQEDGPRQAATVLTITEEGKERSVQDLAISGLAVVRSGNANLSSLRLCANGPRTSGRDLTTLVSPNISGTLNVSPDFNQLYILPVLEDSKARVTVNGVGTPNATFSAPMAMKIGDNSLTVVVTAEDGTIQTYAVVVRRGSFNMIAQRFPKVVPPGIKDGATIGQFYDVSLNDGKGVAYTAQLVGGTGGVAADSAAWSIGWYQTPGLMLRSGPIGGGNSIIVGRDLLYPRILDAGFGSLTSTLLGTGPSGMGQWVDDGLENVTLAAYQTKVFEAPPAFHAFTGFNYTSHGYDLVCFAANLVQGGKGAARVTSLNDSGLWKVNSSGKVTAAAREGEVLPAAVGRGLRQGEVMRGAIGGYRTGIYNGYVTGTGVTSANAEVILTRYLPEVAAPALVVRTGAQAAGLAKGVKYYDFLGEGGYTTKTTFWAQLTGPGVTAENRRALFQTIDSGAGWPTNLLLRDDDDLSEFFGAGVKFRSVLAFWTLNYGKVVVQGQLKGPGITAANDVFVMRIGGGLGWMVIAREGSVVSAAGNSMLDTIQGVDASGNGQVALLCSLVNGTGDTAENLNNQVLLRRYIYRDNQMEALMRKGTPLAGGTSPVYSIQMTKNVVQGNTGSTTGMSRAVNDNGKVAVIVTTMDNNQGVFVGP